MARVFSGFLAASVLVTTPAVNAAVNCESTDICKVLLGESSECVDHLCTNPFRAGGCLANKNAEWRKKRVCASDDEDTDAEERGFCVPPDPVFDYMEVRIGPQNWESATFQAWVLQIILSEVLGIPTSIETGGRDNRLNFYDADMPLQFGGANLWDGLREAATKEDCRDLAASNKDLGLVDGWTIVEEAPYVPCQHVITEVWSTGKTEIFREMEEAKVTTVHEGMGALGQNRWFIPLFTAKADPTLFSYVGMQGEENRRKLAETFKRPTSWKEYCDLVSNDGCASPDDVAKRAPHGTTEESSYFLAEEFTGHFRATDKNNCTANPATCTGHFTDYPCGWASNAGQVIHHLNMAFDLDGPEEVSGGYSYSQLTQVWAAANATKSHVVMTWWTPEALYNEFLGSEAEFQPVFLPTATQECVSSHVSVTERCDPDINIRQGDASGACGDPPHALKRSISTTLYQKGVDPTVDPAKLNPAYETINSLKLSELQIGEIFDKWHASSIDERGFDPRDAVCQWVVENMDQIERSLPDTFPRVVKEGKSITKRPSFTISLAFAGVATAVVLACSFVCYRLRNMRGLRKAQVEFLYLLLAGLFLVALGAICMILPPSGFSCAASVWLINIGYTMELAPLIVKMAAINQIMMAVARSKRVVLKISQLYGVVAMMVGGVVVVLTTWTVLDRPNRIVELEVTDEMTSAKETVVSTISYCSSESDRWSYISLVWFTVLLLCASILAFQTRNIPQDVNESQKIAILIYSQFVFVVLRSVVFGLRNSLDDTRVPLFLSLIHGIDVIVAACVYFIPKFRFTLADPEEDSSNDQQQSSNQVSMVDWTGSGVGTVSAAGAPESKSSVAHKLASIVEENTPEAPTT